MVSLGEWVKILNDISVMIINLIKTNKIHYNRLMKSVIGDI